MIVNISNHDCTIIWDNVYYFVLSEYPNISDWEIKKLILFIRNEKANKRETNITCENNKILETVNYAIKNQELYLPVNTPNKITECTACNQKGCLTDFVCHTASIENARSIFSCGKLLSAVRARKMSGIELAKEPRNAANDPPDFFDYIMFTWGNCQAGDRLVMERLLNRSPNEVDLSTEFKPGIRFYFEYNYIIKHNDYLNDGYTPVKIKNELILLNNLYCCIIPKQYKNDFINIVPDNIKNKVYYIENDCKNIWDWSEKAYDFVRRSRGVHHTIISD